MELGVAGSRPVVPEGDPPPQPQPAFDLLESKFHPPLARPGIVARSTLVERLVAARGRVISVAAPPGYGKTTVLAQLARRVAPRVAWITCDHEDNDPVVLLSAVAEALNRVQPIDPALFAALASSGAGITFVPRFVSVIGRLDPPVTVILDHTEAVTNDECRAMIAEFAVRLPEGWQLALASRDNPPIPTARLRVQDRIVEVGANDLAMDAGETSVLLEGAGLDPAGGRIGELLELTEGWPAALYLAALAIRTSARRSDRRVRFAGDDRFVEDYLRAELLDRVSDAEVEFLTRTSMLDRMCGSLCDTLLDRKGSALTLEQLETRNLLVVPLDHHREWYRYHHLLRDLLQTELRRRAPHLVRDLHARAAAWYEANGMPELAIEHAQQADDYDRAARLVLDLAQPIWASGRAETVLQWMESLRDRTSAQYYSAIAVHGALIFALLGKASEAERWATAAERAPAAGVLPDGSTMAGTLAYLRAILFRDGVAEMRRDARLAWDGLSPSSPYRATMLHTEGMSYLLEDNAERADPIFARAYEAACSSNALPLAALVLAERCFVASTRGDWAEVLAFSERAVTIVATGGFEDYWTSALVYAWATRAALHRRDIAAARQHLAAAARLRPLLTYAIPAVSVQTLLELARSYIALADPGGAGAVLGQAHDIIRQRPNLGTLPGIADDLQRQLIRIHERAIGASSLTAAELRLLPLLETHLSFREIGERLSLSFHTIKSQVYSIYQKLGVSSRSQAVARTHELGLAEL